MKVLDLCSGIGGFALGLERAGFETVQFVEWDKDCQKVLRKHWPDVPIHDDVTTFDGKALHGTVELVCGGYPCQPFSTAGRRRGTEDDRHIWPDILRIVKEVRPTWCLFENVAGHVSVGLDQVLFDLETEGYATGATIIPAIAVNAQHRRDRLWIVAHARGRGQQGQGQPGQSRDHEARGNGQTAHAIDDRIWSPQSRVRRKSDGVSPRVDAVRLKQLGNSVVPQVVEQIGRAIMCADAK